MYEELIKALRRHHCDADDEDTQEFCEECAYSVIIIDGGKIKDDCVCGLMHRAADAIGELQSQIDGWIDQERKAMLKSMPKWIPASTPPNDDRNIFICHGSHDFKAPCIGHYEAYNKTYYEDKNWFASPIYDPMYWCEMPRLPVG